jgi:hypothetical protein
VFFAKVIPLIANQAFSIAVLLGWARRRGLNAITCRRSATAKECLPAMLNAAPRLISMLETLHFVSRSSVYSSMAVSASPLSRACAALQDSGEDVIICLSIDLLQSRGDRVDGTFLQGSRETSEAQRMKIQLDFRPIPRQFPQQRTRYRGNLIF